MSPQKRETQKSSSLLDALHCNEKSLGNELGEKCPEFAEKETSFPSTRIQQDQYLEDSHNEFIMSLLSKEKETHFCYNNVELDKDFIFPRKEAVDWVLKVCAHFGFRPLTALLAVNYLDRLIQSPGFRLHKPWMLHLACVACLSLAAKVEETHVPLLLDLQVEESRYVFEAKTIQRMELLVLSILQWRMHSVTPISFFHHILRRIGLRSNLRYDYISRCECLLLSLIADAGFLCYLPSILAAAIMLHVFKEIEPGNYKEYHAQLMALFKISEDEVKGCHEFILESSRCNENRGHKRKISWIPSSPNGVIDVSFSCDCANDSLVMTPISVSSSPEPQFKRSRAPDQQMRLPSLNRRFVDVISKHDILDGSIQYQHLS